MLLILPCLTTFNVVGFIDESELNNWMWLHIELHLISSIVYCTLPCHASLNRTCIILVCASCHAYACWFTIFLFASFRLRFSLIVPVTMRLWGFVRLRWFVYFIVSFFFLAGFQARWPLPSISLLSLLASCFILSLCCATYNLFTMLPILPCQASNPPFLANRCLAKLLLLLSPSYSVTSCRWSRSLFHVGTCYVGISQYLLFN